jgi:reactive intermediate/imine deaminase
MEYYVRPAGTPTTNGYSHAVAVNGPLLVISGQVPLDEAGQLVGREDAREQVRQVFRNIAASLTAAGATMGQLVKLTVFLTDMADLPAFREVRDEFIALDRPPASSLVQVSGLVNPDFRVEIEAMAAL